ncbi:MAG: uroporphyrinogen-III synthase [Verrucomicrobia bacterium]|nr:uroporphyrinogen-III synthase [Verrucomicrobiota bacterium]
MKKILYLGTDPTHFESEDEVIHYPVIQIVPRPLSDPEVKRVFDDLLEYTHLLFTSKNCVRIFCAHVAAMGMAPEQIQARVIAIGKVTALHLQDRGFAVHRVAQEETQEGLLHLLSSEDLENAYLFLPRSSLSRPILVNAFQEREIRYQACDLYDTLTQRVESKPCLEEIDEIVFTSPSTVRAFLEIFGPLPKDKVLRAIGPITDLNLKQQMQM